MNPKGRLFVASAALLAVFLAWVVSQWPNK